MFLLSLGKSWSLHWRLGFSNSARPGANTCLAILACSALSAFAHSSASLNFNYCFCSRLGAAFDLFYSRSFCLVTRSSLCISVFSALILKVFNTGLFSNSFALNALRFYRDFSMIYLILLGLVLSYSSISDSDYTSLLFYDFVSYIYLLLHRNWCIRWASALGWPFPQCLHL